MRSFLRTILIQHPTPFPWLAVLSLPVMLFYTAIGVVGLLRGTEASMAILMASFLLPKMALLLLADLRFRRFFKVRHRPTLMTESALLLLWAGWYANENLHTTEFVTKGPTPLIVMVEDATGTSPETSLFGLKTTYKADDDNIIVTDRPLRENEWSRLKGRTEGGDSYDQVYSMQYMDSSHNRIDCNGRTHRIRFFMLESGETPRFVFSDRQFDSITDILCRKLPQ